MEERLQKILAQAGFGSRRSCEDLIVAGRVKVNGKIAILGSKADASNDAIMVDGKILSKKPPEKIYVALHKPKWVLSDNQEGDDRKTIFDLVPITGHLFSVGRLDYDSEGLILLTNDGELANRLTHPRYGHEKEYQVRVSARPDAEQLQAWRRGIVLEDGYKTAPARVEIDRTVGSSTWLRIVLREGRKRQIREVGARIGLPVERIIRIRIGTLKLGLLKPSEWRDLSHAEVRALRESVDKPVSRRPMRSSPGGVNKNLTSRRSLSKRPTSKKTS